MKLKTENQLRKINESKSWFYEKINKINEPLPRLNNKRKRTRVTNIRNERR